MGTADGVTIVGRVNGAEKATQADAFVQGYRRTLPVVPGTLFHMNAVLSSSPVNLARLITVVGDDPAMTADLVREANTIDREVVCDRLLDAIVTLGIRRLQALLVRTPLITTAEANCWAYRMWRNHSLLAAPLAEALAGVLFMDPARARLAGLLHDIGKLPLLLRAHAEGKHAEPLLSDAAPCDEVTTTHCEVGAALATSWQFSTGLRQAIRDHHDQQVAPCDTLVGIVVAADRLCHRYGVSLDSEMARIFQDQSLEQIVAGALPYLTEAQMAAALAATTHVLGSWNTLHPGVVREV
jgi:putative nucleotidyltransferase with HDIG domain